MYIGPIALFALWLYLIVQGIHEMTAQERSNHALGRLMGCEYLGRLDEVAGVLVYKCYTGIELQPEFKW